MTTEKLPLTRQQQKLLSFIHAFEEKNGYPPTVREMAQGLELASPASVHNLLKQLVKKKHLQKTDHRSRGLKTKTSLPRYLPLLGEITAGLPILAIETQEKTLPLPQEWLSDGEHFILQVSGSSMSGAGIADRDYVIVRSQTTAHPGEIIVALIGDEATVKRYMLRGSIPYLHPENPAFDDIYPEEWQVLGIVKGLYRKY